MLRKVQRLWLFLQCFLRTPCELQISSLNSPAPFQPRPSTDAPLPNGGKSLQILTPRAGITVWIIDGNNYLLTGHWWTPGYSRVHLPFDFKAVKLFSSTWLHLKNLWCWVPTNSSAVTYCSYGYCWNINQLIYCTVPLICHQFGLLSPY